MSFDPKRIDRLAAKATLLEEQVRALVVELEELAEQARDQAKAEPIIAHDPEPIAAPEPVAEAEEEPEPAPEPEPEPESDDEAGWTPAMPAASEPEPAAAAPEGARLVALNMALRGTPRDETARYLREKYDFEDSDALLDDVYEKAGS
jgi:outer membrane biosynthesis protein TonB